jgi:hypothetical protein
MLQGRCKAFLEQATLWRRGLVCLTRQGHHGAVTRLDAPIGTVHMEHAALEGFNGSDGTRAHHTINDEGTLRGLHMAVKKFLYQMHIIGAIEATMTDRGHNGLHPRLLSVVGCGADVVASVTDDGQPHGAYRGL